jgi:DNA repair protein RecO
MSYSTYTTEAIVCGTRDRNSTDRSYLLFTRDGGMLYAEARGARREGSKQRYALQDFTRIRVSLVRGKSGWRVGSVEALENFYAAASDRAARGSIVMIIKLLRRFAQGEVPLVDLYEYVVGACRVLSKVQTERRFLETCAQVQILTVLGYVAYDALPGSLRTVALAEAAPLATSQVQAELSAVLAAAISHSQL